MRKPLLDTAAVVLGMHRSGTSALAGVLRLKGFCPPRNILPSSNSNERGFWESESINSLNEEFFAELGSAWHGLHNLEFNRARPVLLKEARERAEKVLLDEFEPGVRPLIKDPRLCRLLPLWQPAFAKLCSNVVYAITLRSPLAVAESLLRRNDFDPEFSYLLWARYYLDAEFYTRGQHRLIVNYDELLTDWRKSLGRFPSPIKESVTDQAEIDSYLSSELRHHRTADEQAFIEIEHLPAVGQTYLALLAWAAAGPDGQPDFAALDELRAQFGTAGAMIPRLADNARLDRKRLANAKSRTDAEERAQQALAQLTTSFQKQSEAQGRLEQSLERVAINLSQAIRERASLEQLLVETRTEAKTQREALERELDDRQRDRDLLKAHLEEVRRETKTTIDAISSEQHALRTELKEVKKKYRSTQHQLSADREKLRKVQARLSETAASLTKIQESIVWRLYTGSLAAVRRGGSLVRRAFGPSIRKLREKRATTIRSSHLFDANWYLTRYPDVAAANVDPAIHYLEAGWKEGRDPSASFSTMSYLKQNADVAKAGLNPLLHFIDFGYSEGRSASNSLPSISAASIGADEEFGPAALCVSFPVSEHQGVRWRRWARLTETEGDLFASAGVPIGFLTDAIQRNAIQGAFERLAILSGRHSQISSMRDAHDNADPARSLLDAWYVSYARLRTRWQFDAPSVVRAYQHDPGGDGALAMIGEGLVVSALDVVDLNLSNPYFPVLFVTGDPDGGIRGVEFLAFPSLSRGGLHYPELLALDREACGKRAGPIEIQAMSEALSEPLLGILAGSARPFVDKLVVELVGADGSEPLFQADFQVWLSNVLRIAAEPVGQSAETTGYLLKSSGFDEPVRLTANSVLLPADTIPTISVLVGHGTLEAPGEHPILPLLIADADPSQPVTLIECPLVPDLATNDSEYVSIWPRFVSDEKIVPAQRLMAAAIRHSKRAKPVDAELLVPVAPPALSLKRSNPSITWLVFPEDWTDEALRQGLHALSLQEGCELALIGDVSTDKVSTAKEYLARVYRFADVGQALEALTTPSVGYLGANVILHDTRTSRILSALLEDPAVVSASCVLVSSEKRGKSWNVSVADPGLFSGTSGSEHSLNDRCQHVQRLWRATYPALRPPRDLWVARSGSVAGWLQRAGPLRAHEGVQLCTSLVTASYLGDRHEDPAHLRPPSAAKERTIRSEVLFG